MFPAFEGFCDIERIGNSLEETGKRKLRITAVITTYHREWNCVQRAIESVLGQTLPVTELILVDDNGRGSSWQKKIQQEAEKYPQIRYLPMEKNSGVSAARNHGARAAKGDILGYLDDDDVWCEDKLEKLVPLFMQDPETALVFGTGWVCKDADRKENGKHNWQWEVFKPAPEYADMLYTDYVGSASAPLLRLDALKKLGGFREQPAAEDYELWIRIAQQYRLRGIKDVVFYKHDEPGEHITGSLRRVGYGFRRIYELYYRDYQKNPKAKTAMLWNICRTGVRGLDPTVLPYVLAWLKSRYLPTERI